VSLLLLLKSAAASAAASAAIVADPARLQATGRSIVLTPRAAPPAAGVQYRSSSNTGNAVGAVTSRAPAVPAGATTNDIVLVFLDLWDGSADPTVTPPAGFTQKYKVSAGTGVKSYCFWKRLTGADAGTYSFTWGATGMFATADAMCFSGCITTGDPIGSNFNTATANSSTFPNTTVSPAYIPGLAWHGYNDTGGTHTPPTGYTEAVDVDCATDAYFLPVAAGPYTATAATVSTSSDILAGLVALQPDSVAGPSPVTTLVFNPQRPPAPGRSIVVGQLTDTPVAAGTTPTATVVVADTGRTRLPGGAVRILTTAASPAVPDVTPAPAIVLAQPRTPTAGRAVLDGNLSEASTPIVPIVSAQAHPPASGRALTATAAAEPPPPPTDTPTVALVAIQSRVPSPGRSIITSIEVDAQAAPDVTPVPPVVQARPFIPTPGVATVVRSLTDTPIAVGDSPTRPLVAGQPGPRPAGVAIVIGSRLDVAGAPDVTPQPALVETGQPAQRVKAGAAFTVSGFADQVGPVLPVIVTRRQRPEPGRTLVLAGRLDTGPVVTPTTTLVRVIHPGPQPGRSLLHRARIEALLIGAQTGHATAGAGTTVQATTGPGMQNPFANPGLGLEGPASSAGAGTQSPAATSGAGTAPTATGGA
jgi:hypothetical protein